MGRASGSAPVPPPPPPPVRADLLVSAPPVVVPPPASVPPPATVPADAPMPVSRSTDAAAPDAPQLDLAFCCDCTGSMGAYIKAAQENIRAIAQRIHDRKSASCSLRFALVKYRDHPPQDRTFVTEVYPFTKSLEVMKANVDTMAASGGGDGPEAVTAALHEVLELNWRPNATKVCVFIADAPPHGLGENGDGFPEGSPDGRDPLEVTRALASKGVTVYAIGVEPVLSSQYKFARDFMMMVASVTEGKFLPLGKAGILADVIVSTAVEGLELEQMWGQLEAEVAQKAAANGEDLTSEELCAKVEKAMAERSKDTAVEQIDVANPYMDARYDHANHHMLKGAKCLREARAQLRAETNAHVAQESAAYAWQAQAMTSCAPAPVSHEQMP